MFDNTNIHKTKEVKFLVKKLGWVVFTIPPFSSELNQIEHSFGILKSKISKKNFNGKTMMEIVKDEILCLLLLYWYKNINLNVRVSGRISNSCGTDRN